MKALESLTLLKDFVLGGFDSSLDKTFIKGACDIIEKELKAFEIIKDFIWIENGEMHLGLYGDIEITLREDDFESKEKYDLLKEELE